MKIKRTNRAAVGSRVLKENFILAKILVQTVNSVNLDY